MEGLVMDGRVEDNRRSSNGGESGGLWKGLQMDGRVEGQ